jgi:peptidoglycan biosynthesis protein MviN/MurJ (putative lipid II flippase)
LSSHRGGKLLGTILGFTAVSRAVGILREMIIVAGFGFSRATDGFYQLAATPTYLVTFLGGPFSTAYIAWSNREDAADEGLRVAILLRWLLVATALLGAVFLAVALALQFAGQNRDAQCLPPILMALACAATGVIGLSAAVTNARARFAQAQAVLFVNNIGFVLLLGIGALLLRHQPGPNVELALTGAFAGATLIAALYGWRLIRQGADTPYSPAQRAAVAISLRRVFLPMLGMAGSETLGFLASQAVVLWLAAQSGAGVTSAGSLAQRIALTANGLVIGPLANVAMVRLMRLERQTAQRYLLRVAGLTLAGLA